MKALKAELAEEEKQLKKKSRDIQVSLVPRPRGKREGLATWECSYMHPGTMHELCQVRSSITQETMNSSDAVIRISSESSFIPRPLPASVGRERAWYISSNE